MSVISFVRKALETMYCGTCDVIIHEKVTDPVTKKTAFVDSILLSSQPCRLSYNSSPTTGDGNTSEVTEEIKLFLSPDVEIPSGSKIEVTQSGRTKTFTNASESRVYDSHQEITLKLFDRWA